MNAGADIAAHDCDFETVIDVFKAGAYIFKFYDDFVQLFMTFLCADFAAFQAVNQHFSLSFVSSPAFPN